MGLHYCLVFLCAIGVAKIALTRKLVYRWDGFNCTGNDKYVEYVNCSVRQPDRRVFNVTLLFQRDMIKMKLRFRLFLLRNGIRNSQPIIDVNLNVCFLLSGTLKNNFLSNIPETLKKSSNLPPKCPFFKDTVYYLRDFTVGTKLVPPFVGETDFFGDVSFFVPAKGFLVDISVHGRLLDEDKMKRKP